MYGCVCLSIELELSKCVQYSTHLTTHHNIQVRCTNIVASSYSAVQKCDHPWTYTEWMNENWLKCVCVWIFCCVFVRSGITFWCARVLNMKRHYNALVEALLSLTILIYDIISIYENLSDYATFIRFVSCAEGVVAHWLYIYTRIRVRNGPKSGKNLARIRLYRQIAKV